MGQKNRPRVPKWDKRTVPLSRLLVDYVDGVAVEVGGGVGCDGVHEADAGVRAGDLLRVLGTVKEQLEASGRL